MAQPIWKPDPERAASTRIARLAAAHGFDDYPALHRYSVESSASFWREMWTLCEVIGEPGDVVLAGEGAMPGAKWFPEARLNFAENLLRYEDDHPAILSAMEDGRRSTLTYRELGLRVGRVAAWLQAQGVVAGDRVAAFMPNVPETVIAMLATTTLGATFSSCSPDFGIQGACDRFGQIDPVVLICADGYYYGGKEIDISDRVASLVDAVASVRAVLVADILGRGRAMSFKQVSSLFDDLPEPDRVPAFARMPFAHPAYILYSSGTTGMPKCIVHSAGGTLLQHMKEHQFHLDLHRHDILFYFTTCGWMMWNWLVSGLASGATLVLYDGSPLAPNPGALWDMAEREGVTIFGTSAKYLAGMEKAGLRPAQTHDLSSLRSILSTGSPLSHESFRYVYREVKADVCLSSISGGTDIVSCFALGNPSLPVYEGELQCIGLGMDVHIYNDDGISVVGEKGELVCTSPFPSMPVGFWQDESGERYRQAYFERFPGVWSHGDYGEMTAHGGMIIYGRSDAVLNPGGVRIGTAEIYRQVEKVDDVVDALCIGQEWEGDVRIVLFVVLREGAVLSDELRQQIVRTIRAGATPRHVPAKIIEVADIPRTISGKISELAVREVVHGRRVKNTDALANPGALDQFRNLAELRDP
ncbi:MAG: acetoacetate--CoA ligase [Pseudomonadales bacterium]|nr:acetoacetate--CoA ligase [Pseudomonadales bacterium]